MSAIHNAIGMVNRTTAKRFAVSFLSVIGIIAVMLSVMTHYAMFMVVVIETLESAGGLEMSRAEGRVFAFLFEVPLVALLAAGTVTLVNGAKGYQFNRTRAVMVVVGAFTVAVFAHIRLISAGAV